MVDIPPALLNAIKEQRVVLFLGSGASKDAKHPNNTKMPQGNDLRDLICEKFLGGALMQKPLNVVAAMAANEAGFIEFQTYIRELFMPFDPAAFHLSIPTFRWRAIATTNFDMIIEKAYENTPNRRQNLVKTVKNGDRFDIRMNKETNPLGFYKLHGCIDSYVDVEIPLILGLEQYTSYDTNRDRFYHRFRDLGYEYPIIFTGYSISDPHIQKILFALTDSSIGRPPFYMIYPGVSDIERRYWDRHSVFSIDATFEDFLGTIDKMIPPAARVLPIGIGGGELSVRKHYKIAHAVEPSTVANYLATDATHVHSGLTTDQQEPSEFYRGYDKGWGCILQNLDAHRSFSDSVLVDAVLLAEENRRVAELFMLKGPAGNGKSVSLKRIAWETGVTYEKLTLFSDGPAGLNIDILNEIYQLTGERTFLFIDHVALVRNELQDLLQASRARSIPLSVIGAERDNEWNIYCEQLEPFVRQEFPVRYLSEREIDELLVLLERHNSLGLLKDHTPEDRAYAFIKSAERQLLVALHELTLGAPFEDIVFDEFSRIEPSVARNMYLDICALHQFGAPVRAGLVSRASGIGFERFQTTFIQPLENIVHVVKEGHTRDVYYRSRHQHVAEMVFNRALPTAEDKFDLLSRVLRAINVDYTSDRETFSRLIKGRGLAEMFPSADLGRLFYDRIQGAVPNDPFVLHQRAVFEIQHRGGSLVLAEKAAARAFELNPNNHSIQHTQGDIARRQANETDDPLRKRALRRTTREKLGGNVSRLSEYDLNTRAHLAIDEFREILDSLDEFDEQPPPNSLLEAAKEAETIIQRGLQTFPESSELLTAEARFRELLDDNSRALRALERAFGLNPRQDWLAVRLARKYQESGDFQNSKGVLETCLRDNPSSKLAHLELGRVLVASGDNSAAIEHLRRGFTIGDNHYEAQFWYARELCLQGRFAESDELFSALNDRAPGRFRTRAAAAVERVGAPTVHDCRVGRKEEGYAFLKLPQFPENIFASRAESDPVEWDKLYMGARTTCVVAFNRRGPRATSVCLTS